jgi:hypothetical protein
MPEITQEDFELLEAYKKLGDPEDLAEAVGERDSIKRTGAVQMAAQLLGYKPSVLDRLAAGMEISVRDEKAFIKDGDTEKELSDYADENWKEFLPSLKAEESSSKPKGVSYVPQSATGRSASKNTKKGTTDFIKQKYGWVFQKEAAAN